jgi:glucose-6-phosphate isomerase
MSSENLWKRYQQHLCVCDPIGLTLDISRMKFPGDFFARHAPSMKRAFDEMDALEKGAIANPDEKRQVGHYWLRNPSLAPDPAQRQAIESALQQIHTFTRQVHSGEVKPERAARFEHLLLVGIGGSALGPQLLSDSLGCTADRMSIAYFDNTDPDGFDKVISCLGERLERTLTLVISKSGGTKETRNGMLEAQSAYQRAGLDFGRHAVAVTGEGSELDGYAIANKWLERFPMWDWVGGRTSVTSAVGLLPAALLGMDIEALLSGARDTDALTRQREVEDNPAALLALMWLHGSDGRGAKDLVILPYKDRLQLMSRYLQQLVMESIGKEKDLEGKVVNGGLTVYGNKGSTDQHAYVQQLREGVHNFFATFIEVLDDRDGSSIEVEPGVTSGDYLLGFLLGTRRALYEKGRESMTITLDVLGPRQLGVLIALHERAVGFYASLLGINAYHQPGVEAGKKAAGVVLQLQAKLLAALSQGPARTAEQLAAEVGASEEVETVHQLLLHLSANPDHRVLRMPGESFFSARYQRGN